MRSWKSLLTSTGCLAPQVAPIADDVLELLMQDAIARSCHDNKTETRPAGAWRRVKNKQSHKPYILETLYVSGGEHGGVGRGGAPKSKSLRNWLRASGFAFLARYLASWSWMT